MRLKTFTAKVILFICVSFAMAQTLFTQTNNYTFKAPCFIIDFGVGKNVGDINELRLPKYNRVFDVCPQDGNYSFVSHTGNCFNGDWHTFNQDHTAKNKDGNMMLVNANETGGVFLNTTINNLKSKTTYQLAVSLVNVCRIGGGCSPLPANINIKLITQEGRNVASFQTGGLVQTAAPRWKVYSGIFTTPENATTFRLIMEDMTLGGCGNDFALDDITLRECVVPIPVAKKEVKAVPKPLKGKADSVNKATVKKMPLKPAPVKSDSVVIAYRKTNMDRSSITNLKTKKTAPVHPIPNIVLTRENPLIKQIETEPGEILVELYDNGQVDGDTVSVYHNNELIVSRAGLSHQPVSFRIKVDTLHPHHELIMIANNLGSIPPNTSLMVITAKSKRYEVFISSSEQKNAKIVINLKQ
jgi:hypothetical protein